MAIVDWHENEKPREKLLARGPTSVTDAELLAIILRTGVQGESAIELAGNLICRFGSLRGLMNATPSKLCEVRGLGTAKAAQLLAVLELAKRQMQEVMKRGSAVTDPALAEQYLIAHLRHRHHEIFAVMFLDTRHRLIVYEELFQGTIDGASVYPRVVVERALSHQAAAVILAHNHPSGVAEASNADIQITHRLKDALALIDVRVLDHLIIGDGETLSFANQGLLLK